MGTVNSEEDPVGTSTGKSRKREDKRKKSSKRNKNEQNTNQCADWEEAWKRIYGPCQPVNACSDQHKKDAKQKSSREKGGGNLGNYGYGQGSAGYPYPQGSSYAYHRNSNKKSEPKSTGQENGMNGWECNGYYLFPTGLSPMFKHSSGDQKPAPVCPQFCLPQGYVDACCSPEESSESEESSSERNSSNNPTCFRGNAGGKRNTVNQQSKGTKADGKSGKNLATNTSKGSFRSHESLRSSGMGSSYSSNFSSSSNWSSSYLPYGSNYGSCSTNNTKSKQHQQQGQSPCPGNMIHACMGTYPQTTQAMQANQVQLSPHWPPKPGPEFSSSPKDEEGLDFQFKPRPDFATEVTFTIEPKKKPMWQKMMRCGFRPMITCGAPPFNLPSNFDQAQKICSGEASGDSSSSSSDSTSGTDSSGSSESDSGETETSEGTDSSDTSDYRSPQGYRYSSYPSQGPTGTTSTSKSTQTTKSSDPSYYYHDTYTVTDVKEPKADSKKQ